MARILIGIMGDAGGHISQALAVANELPHHEFLFIGGGRVLDLRGMGYAVEEVPVTSTYYVNNRVDVTATVRNAVKVLFGRNRTVERVVDIVKDFDPALILTAYEYFAPLAAHKLGIPCVSIDNHHFLNKCVHEVPKGQSVGRLMYSLPLRWMFSNADYYFISAFYKLPPAHVAETEVFPPVLRRAVLEVEPADGDHVLVYQTSPTFRSLVPALEEIPHKVIIYGWGDQSSSKNLEYRPPSITNFLKDLATCRYLITNGGHNAIAEALYFGKPVFSFPIRFAYEQFFNAFMVASLGYGDYSLVATPDAEVFKGFESRLDGFRARIAGGDFYGNVKLASRLEEMIVGQQG
ncbi:MAG: glycosyltransferase family protein [Desulfomonilaceae bacterium]